MEKDRRSTLEQTLGQQAVNILHTAGFRNLCVEKDGSVSGEIEAIRGLPQVDTVKNLTIKTKRGRIVICGEVIHSIVDVGKIY